MNEARPPAALPVILELATLPREQVGPFLILGVDKVADREEIEAAWAKRLIWARKGMVRTTLEDINWARETLNDPERRIRSDAASLNLDTSDGVLRGLGQRFGGKNHNEPGCRPIDMAPPAVQEPPAGAIPAVDDIRREIVVGDVPRDLPGLAVLLDEFLAAPLDPWELALPAEEPG